MRDYLVQERCFTKLLDGFQKRLELKSDTAVELLEQQWWHCKKAIERQHVSWVRHYCDHLKDETIEELPKFDRRHRPALDLPTVTDMGNLGDVDTTSVTPDQPQPETPRQPVEEDSTDSTKTELTSVALVVARAGLAGYETISRVLGNIANKARALFTKFTAVTEAIERKPNLVSHRSKNLQLSLA